MLKAQEEGGTPVSKRGVSDEAGETAMSAGTPSHPGRPRLQVSI